MILKSFDFEKKVIILETEELAITSKNGRGYILTVGGWAGIICYFLNDYTLECGIKKIDNVTYELISSNIKYLNENKIEFVVSSNEKFKIFNKDLYKSNNTPLKNTSKIDFTMQNFIKNNIFSYNYGKLTLLSTNERFLPVEISLLYKMEKFLEPNIVASISYETFKNIGKNIENKKEPILFILQILTALGFGVAEMIKSSETSIILFKGYPWFEEISKNNFVFITNAISGFLDGNANQKLKIKNIKNNLINNIFNLSFEVFY